RDSGDDRRQPRAEVLDLARVGAAHPQPRVLDGIVRLAERAEHAVGHRTEMRPVLLELPGQPFLLVQVTSLPHRVSYPYDPRRGRDVTESDALHSGAGEAQVERLAVPGSVRRSADRARPGRGEGVEHLARVPGRQRRALAVLHAAEDAGRAAGAAHDDGLI